MKSIFISIIVPIYKVEKYLSTCIESLLTQSYQNFEIILVNDGSPDNSGKICDEYAKKDSRIKVYHKKNGGVSSARNLGIDKAQGEWISFVDADDWVEDNYCESLFSIEKKSDLIFFPATHHYSNGFKKVFIPTQGEYNTKEEIEYAFLSLKNNSLNHDFFGYTWNKFFKTNIIKENKIYFVDSLSIREDEIFTANYSRYINSLIVISLPLYNYRVLSTGLTAREKKYSELLLLANKLEEELAHYYIPSLIAHERRRVINYKKMAMDKLRSPSKVYNLFKEIHIYWYTHKKEIVNLIDSKTLFLLSKPIIMTYPIYMMSRYFKLLIKKIFE